MNKFANNVKLILLVHKIFAFMGCYVVDYTYLHQLGCSIWNPVCKRHVLSYLLIKSDNRNHFEIRRDLVKLLFAFVNRDLACRKKNGYIKRELVTYLKLQTYS